jgi:hypothetical protein
MTLKERFEQFTEQKSYDKKNYNAEECEQIADDYAISFAKWIIINCNHKKMEYLDLKELLEMFKSEKKL